MLKSKIYLVLGIDTDIGKTFLVENLCQILAERRVGVMAVKPVVSGFSNDDKNSDPVRILNALGLKLSQQNFDLTAPWRFKTATSPHFAAKVSGQKIDFEKVKKFCLKQISAAKKNDDFLLIEAAGGVMTPINDDKIFLDLAAELKIPTLLLTANYLGSISHTLCAVEVLKGRGVMIEKIITNDFSFADKKSSLASNLDFIETVKNSSEQEVVLLSNFLQEIRQ